MNLYKVDQDISPECSGGSGGDEVIYNEVLEYDNYVKRDYSYDQEGEYSNYDSHSL